MNISKFTQKSLQAVQNLEKTAGTFTVQSASSGRQSDFKDDRKDGD